MVEWREWQKEWQNGRMAEMATYATTTTTTTHFNPFLPGAEKKIGEFSRKWRFRDFPPPLCYLTEGSFTIVARP